MNSPVVHLELHTRSLPAAADLYRRLCGWQPEHIAGPRPYVALDLGWGVGGGIVECGTARSLWLPYVRVPDIVAATERARALGATVLFEPHEGPAGWRSVVITDHGGEIAFWQLRGTDS